MTKSKTLTAVVAFVLVLTITLGGSVAWQSISQRVTNEFSNVVPVNPGGRLHDDFNGENKDIYVENFGNEEIFARVRLTEYMEIGKGAGLLEGEPGYADKEAQPLVSGADINNESTWAVHILGADEVFHKYYTWKLGNTAAVSFMPTFNLNKDSLKADTNGTFEGPDGDRLTAADRYADYIKWVNGETKVGDEVFDADDNPDDEGSAAVEGVNITIAANREHTARPTGTASVLTMAQWKAQGSPLGDYWVYDTDGWAYWASPIKPGEATGLLLDEVKLAQKPDSDYYYAISAEAQMCTETDWFSDPVDVPSQNADDLFAAILAKRAPDSISLSEKAADVARGESHKLSASATVNGHASDAEIKWTVTDEDGKPVSSTINQSGYLTVATDAAIGSKLKVTAKSTADETVSASCIVTVS